MFYFPSHFSKRNNSHPWSLPKYVFSCSLRDSGWDQNTDFRATEEGIRLGSLTCSVIPAYLPASSTVQVVRTFIPATLQSLLEKTFSKVLEWATLNTKSVCSDQLAYIVPISPSLALGRDWECGLWSQMSWMWIQTNLITKCGNLSKFFTFSLPPFPLCTA